MKVIGEQTFSVPAHYFGISGSAVGYTLQYSVDGKAWASWEEDIPAYEPLFVANAPLFCQYCLAGNEGEVEIRW